MNQLGETVETICTLGCRRVYEVIAALERGEAPEPVGTLEPRQYPALLAELKSIMAVYEASDGEGTCANPTSLPANPPPSKPGP